VQKDKNQYKGREMSAKRVTYTLFFFAKKQYRIDIVYVHIKNQF